MMRQLSFCSILFFRIHRKISLLKVNYHTIFSLEKKRNWQLERARAYHSNAHENTTKFKKQSTKLCQHLVQFTWFFSLLFIHFTLISNGRLIKHLTDDPLFLLLLCIVFFFFLHFIPGIAFIFYTILFGILRFHSNHNNAKIIIQVFSRSSNTDEISGQS